MPSPAKTLCDLVVDIRDAENTTVYKPKHYKGVYMHAAIRSEIYNYYQYINTRGTRTPYSITVYSKGVQTSYYEY